MKQCPEVPRARDGPLSECIATARGMSRPTPIVLILVGIGLGLFGLRVFGIGWLQYEWVLALYMPSCIRLLPLRHCETPKSKLRHWRSPLTLASVGTAPISVAMWVSCELRRRSPRSCSLELACHDRPEGKVPHVSTLCSESELFDTALENCRAQTEFIPDASEPRAPAPCGMRA